MIRKGLELVLVEQVLDRDHGELDEVRGGALHRRIDRRALGGLAAAPGAPLFQLGEPEAPAEHGLDVADSRALARVSSM